MVSVKLAEILICFVFQQPDQKSPSVKVPNPQDFEIWYLKVGYSMYLPDIYKPFYGRLILSYFLK